ncbi:aminodeoxychorismate lyase [Vibrio sp. S11_S32]|uniref:aminodeoxychorismate lyase n=1 Tax=Vibrio sp. S11_S32 TaxID=2720225 RepID=UPI001680D629|nr:aminodeoxychorismate lyase [Vibrio sp. S11_S32]MBD1575469.1 aminodeoxychorismate lyase [Vibrio sp. S11_S32]
MFYVNGKPQTEIAISDRSFQYGDGCFTTMLVVNGHIQHWALHQQRLEQALSVLQMPLPDWKQVQQWLAIALEPILQASLASSIIRSGLKLHISRGCGGRGYSAIGADTPLITIHTFDYPQHYQAWQTNGIKLGISDLSLGLNPMLAGIKHNNRLEQVLIKSKFAHTCYDDVVVCDINQQVIETSASNLFWIKNNHLYTADLSSCGVTGTMRQQVLQLAQSFNLNVNMANYVLADLLGADEVFISNALHGIVPVVKIDTGNSHLAKKDNPQYCYPIGNQTRQFQERLNS